ncbi:MAG: hypothetical protein AAF700_04490 [Pseudomonadota bacterium]
MNLKPALFAAFTACLSACASPSGVFVTRDAEPLGGNLFFEYLSETEGFLVLDGMITPETSYVFQSLVAQNEITGLVITQSPGGDTNAAHQIGRSIRGGGIDTMVVGFCYSACVDVFAAGDDRVVSEIAELGLHSWKSEGPVEESLAIAQDYWREMGYPRTIMAKAFKVPHENMWVIKPERARALKLATEIVSFED